MARHKKSHSKKSCLTGKGKLKKGYRLGKGGRCIKAKKK